MDIELSPSQMEISNEIDFLTKDSFIQLFKEDIEHHYNILEEMEQIPRNRYSSQKISNYQQRRCEQLLGIRVFLSLCGPLICTKIFIQDALSQVLGIKFCNKVYGSISNPLKYFKFFLGEFQDQLIFMGLKNIKNIVERNIQQIQESLNDQLEDKNIILNAMKSQIGETFQYFLNQKEYIRTPNDHRRFSSCMLIRNSSLSNNALNQFQDESEQQMQEKVFEMNFFKMSSEFTDIQVIKEKVLQQNLLTLIQLFVGDISQHRYLQDNHYIERHILASRCEKYKPKMDQIFESEEEDTVLDIKDLEEQMKRRNSNKQQKLNKMQKNQQFQQGFIQDEEEEENLKERQEILEKQKFLSNLKSFRDTIQKELKSVLEVYKSGQFQKILKNIITKQCDKILQELKDIQAQKSQQSIQENYHNIVESLKVSISKQYEIKQQEYPKDILKLISSIYPSYNCYIDLEEPEVLYNPSENFILADNRPMSTSETFQKAQEVENSHSPLSLQGKLKTQASIDMVESLIDIPDYNLAAQMSQNSSWIFM